MGVTVFLLYEANFQLTYRDGLLTKLALTCPCATPAVKPSSGGSYGRSFGIGGPIISDDINMLPIFVNISGKVSDRGGFQHNKEGS